MHSQWICELCCCFSSQFNAEMDAAPLAILALILVQLTLAKNNFELQFENFTCSRTASSQPNPMQRARCALSKNPKRRTLHMEFVLSEALQEHEFHIIIILPRRNSDFLLVNVTTDGCQLLSNRNQVPLIRISREILDRYSNFPRQCPFEPAKSYYMRGFRLDLSMLPAVMMETPVSVYFSYNWRQMPILEGEIKARVQWTSNPKNKRKNEKTEFSV